MQRAFRASSSLLAILLAGCIPTRPGEQPCADDCLDDGGKPSAATGNGGATGAPNDSGTDATSPEAGSSGMDAGGSHAGGDGGDSGSPADAGGSGGASGSSSGTGAVDGGSDCDACPTYLPYCSDDRCVECNEDGHCDDGVCEDHECVECRDNNQCTSKSASRCSAHQCVPCSASADCNHLEDARLCDNDQCVECTGDRYAACGTNGSSVPLVCDSLTRTCSNNTEHSAGLCEPCVSDAQCGEGQLCVMQTFNDPDDDPDQGELDVGYFCFWREDSDQLGAPAGSCANARPFVDTRTAPAASTR